MREIILYRLAVALAFLFGTAAMAADLPARYPAPAPVYAAAPKAFSWTGFYVGGVASYGFGSQSVDSLSSGGVVVPVVGYSGDPRGLGLGVTVGYNYQFDGGVVVGVEGDYSIASMKTSFPSLGAVAVNGKIDRYGTLRARLGYAMGAFLPYVTGGLYTQSERASLGVPANVSADKTSYGWTAGVGVEYALTEHVSLKGEYLYARVANNDFTANLPPVVTASTKGHQNLARMGLNWRF